MSAQDKSDTGTFVWDTTNEVVVTVSVPTDEVWFVDKAFIIGDGSGAANGDPISIGIVPTPGFLSGFSFPANGLSQQLNISGASEETDQVAIGEYAPGGSEIAMATSPNGTGDGTTISYGISIRRIA